MQKIFYVIRNKVNVVFQTISNYDVLDDEARFELAQ